MPKGEVMLRLSQEHVDLLNRRATAEEKPTARLAAEIVDSWLRLHVDGGKDLPALRSRGSQKNYTPGVPEPEKPARKSRKR